MGYVMKYHQHLCKQLIRTGKGKKKRCVMKWVCLLGVLLFGLSLRRNAFWREFSIPGDSAVTVAAVETFVEELEAGVPLDAAFRSFCMEIVMNE